MMDVIDVPGPRSGPNPHQRPDPVPLGGVGEQLARLRAPVAVHVPLARCGHCGRPLARNHEQYAVLADSSFLDPTDPMMDGRRVVAVCNDEHLRLLRAATPRFVEDELWALRLDRVTDPRHPGSLAGRARRAGLTTAQAHRAVRWRRIQSTRPHADPGGRRHT